MRDKQSTVGGVMAQTVVAVSPTASYKEVARTLAQWEVSAVPVPVGEGRVIGVVSEADLLSKEKNQEAAGTAGRGTGPCRQRELSSYPVSAPGHRRDSGYGGEP
ncbi:CBS domain-containing protein [Streptomyces abikoensis]|uniref:CBS domain-containing protein n=1 Tax=Streptomyces abikoensis TaxID=97398 RepID=UPI003F4CF331